MSTDLRRALRDAVSDEPPLVLDPLAITHVGRHRQRQRAGLAIGAAALASAAVLATAFAVSRPARQPEPEPAEQVVRLDLGDAATAEPGLVAQTRTTWRDVGRASLAHDSLEGITSDGLVLRGRSTASRPDTELGLLDPASGVTDWLPPAPQSLYGMQPLALDADRLVLGVAAGNGHSVAVFDRTARTWERVVVRVPSGVEVHLPPRMALGPEERVYIGSTMEDGPTPLHWWSAPIATGGATVPEAALDGSGVAWSGLAELVAHPDGRVRLITPTTTWEVADERPAGCDVIEKWPDSPPQVLLADDRAVVTWFCESGPVTMVYQDGKDAIQVAGAVARAADQGQLLLTGASGPAAALGSSDTESSGTYLLDLDTRDLVRIDDGPWERQVALAAGLVLWNTAGPIEDSDTYDVIWKVAALR